MQSEIKNSAGRKKLPDGEKRVALYVFVKKKNTTRAKKELQKVVAKYA